MFPKCRKYYTFIQNVANTEGAATYHGKAADGVAGEHCVEKLCTQLLSLEAVIQGDQYNLPNNFVSNTGGVQLPE